MRRLLIASCGAEGKLIAMVRRLLATLLLMPILLAGCGAAPASEGATSSKRP